MRRFIFGGLILTAIALFLSLGVWQVQRLAWKTDLIARVNARVHAPAVPAPMDWGRIPMSPEENRKGRVPAPDDWGHFSKQADEYRHVTVHGHFLNAAETQVYTVSDYGPGYWVMTPLVTDEGKTIYINRGFVPEDKKLPATRPEAQINAEVTVTGLLRMPETKRWLFQQANDQRLNAWYSRDIAEMADMSVLGLVAPYFIDADNTPNPGGWPKGGLTVIAFPNSHLTYALTWFSLAAMLIGVSVWLVWFRKAED